MKLTPHEERGVKGAGDKLDNVHPPYFASLIDGNDTACPIRLQSVPQDHEFKTGKDEMLDPCGEEKNSQIMCLVTVILTRLFVVNRDARDVLPFLHTLTHGW